MEERVLSIGGLWLNYLFSFPVEGKGMNIKVEKKKNLPSHLKAINRVHLDEESLFNEDVFGLPVGDSEIAVVSVKYYEGGLFVVDLNLEKVRDNERTAFCEAVYEFLGPELEKFGFLEDAEKLRRFVFIVYEYLGKLLRESVDSLVPKEDEPTLVLQKRFVREVFPSKGKVPHKLLAELSPVYVQMFCHILEENRSLEEIARLGNIYAKAISLFFHSVVSRDIVPFSSLSEIEEVSFPFKQMVKKEEAFLPYSLTEKVKLSLREEVELTKGEAVLWYYESELAVLGSPADAFGQVKKFYEAYAFFARDVSEIEITPTLIEHLVTFIRFSCFLCFPGGIEDALKWSDELRSAYGREDRKKVSSTLKDFLECLEDNLTTYRTLIEKGISKPAYRYLREKGVRPSSILLKKCLQ